MSKEKIVYVYVKSEKVPVFISKVKKEVITPTYSPSGIEEPSQYIVYEEILNDNTKRIIKLVEEIAKQRGYSVEVIDITKKHFLERIITKHIEGISEYPCVVGWNELKVYGENIQKEDLEEIMPYEFNEIYRAFIFIKTELGKAKEIRDRLMMLKEVKEAHLITGEWDILTILELKSDKEIQKTKQIIDFVENVIAKIEGIIDTNTIIPEFGLTKFPVRINV